MRRSTSPISQCPRASARTPSDRAFVAGMRMLFGTAASVVVALGTVPIGRWLTGSSAAQAYLAAAVGFSQSPAQPSSSWSERPIARRQRSSAPCPQASRSRSPASYATARSSTLNAAMVAMIVAVTVLGKSVLYYFKYLLNDPDAGQLALASMGVVSGIAIPLWMLCGALHRPAVIVAGCDDAGDARPVGLRAGRRPHGIRRCSCS